MEQHKAIASLAFLRERLSHARDDNDWQEVTKIDREICEILEDVDRESRSPELAAEVARVKALYQDVLEYAAVRQGELKKKMAGLRNNRSAMKGYGTSLAAGNKELRAKA
ncbi:MAG: hypothetical protein ACR2PT_12185 [Endozoicomonas sp.]